MDKVKELHEQKFGPSLRWISTRYYDYPDGQDLLGKLSFTTKVAGMVGATHGVFQAVAAVPPITQKRDMIFRVAKSAVPAVAIAATFTCVTYYATVFRKKDDELNYFLGGAASGALFGTIIGNTGLVFVASFALGATGVIQKMVHDRGLKLINPVKRRSSASYYRKNWDLTLLPDTRRGNWTKDLPTD